MTDTPTRVRRYWVEESDAGEFFEDYPEPGYNKCELLVVDEAMIERAAYELERLLYASSSFSKDVAKAALRAALGVDDVE